MLGSTGGDNNDSGVRVPVRPPMTDRRGKLALTVPARVDSVRVVRAVMRSWAATVGFVLDEIEELCLAVDEAFAGLISTQPAPTQVVVRIESDAESVDILAVRDTEAELWPPISAQTALVKRVLSTLIDDVRFERTPDGPAIHLVKRRVGETAAPKG